MTYTDLREMIYFWITHLGTFTDSRSFNTLKTEFLNKFI
jgi:hypothetical protein